MIPPLIHPLTSHPLSHSYPHSHTLSPTLTPLSPILTYPLYLPHTPSTHLPPHSHPPPIYPPTPSLSPPPTYPHPLPGEPCEVRRGLVPKGSGAAVQLRTPSHQGDPPLLTPPPVFPSPLFPSPPHTHTHDIHPRTKDWGNEYDSGQRCRVCGKELSTLYQEEHQAKGWGLATDPVLNEALIRHRADESTFKFTSGA